MTHIVHAGHTVAELEGQGIEYLMDKDDNVIAVFVNGNFERVTAEFEGSQDITEVLAA